MAPSCLCCILLLLHVLVFFIHPSSSNDLVNQICKYNNDPAFCIRNLNDDPRTPGANLTMLGTVSIEHGLATGTEITNFIITKNGTTTDGRLRECFNSCFDLHMSALDCLVNASDSLSTQYYGAMKMYAGAAGLFPRDCEDTFKQPPTRPSPLTGQNDNFIQLTQATVVISKFLQGGI